MKMRYSGYRFLFLAACLCVVLLTGCADYGQAKQAKQDGNYTEAFEQYSKLAEYGHAPSQVELAKMYIKGDGVTKDPYRGAQLLRDAAGQDYGKAYFELGRLYEKGEGVEQNYALAIENYNKAVDNDYDRAKENLARILVNTGAGAQPKETENVAY